MAREVDIPISDLYKPICGGVVLFGSVAFASSYALYEDAGGLSVMLSQLVSFIVFLAGVVSFIYVFIKNKCSTLENYSVLNFAVIVLFVGLFLMNFFVFAFAFNPVPLVLSTPMVIVGFLYVYICFVKSKNTVKMSGIEDRIKSNGFYVRGGKVFLRKKILNEVDGSIGKYPIKVMSGVSAVFPIVFIAGLAMVGGFYKLTPNPDLFVRCFFAIVSFFIIPPFVLMLTVATYVNFIIPKRVYGNGWKDVWREVE